jgi:ribosomal protein S18 acetylase RimI-like enzyme
MIRSLIADDRAPIEQMVRATGVFMEEEVTVALELVDHALNKPGQDDYIFFVHEAKGKTLGYACIGKTPMTDATWDLYWIVVDPTAHGQGIGQALTLKTEEYVTAHSGRLIVIETSSKPSYDRTRKFYVDAGYVQLAEIANYYRANDSLVVFGKYFR